jgi:hypothetical protein
LTDDTTYIYPIKLGADGQEIAIAFDEEELQSLVKILKKADLLQKILYKCLLSTSSVDKCEFQEH